MPTILKTSKQSAETRHVEGVQFLCCDCRKTYPVQSSGGTGYATLPDGGLCCYPCTDERTKRDLLTSNRITLYVSSDGRNLTTWTGGVLGRVSFGNAHPWSRERSYLRAYDVHGQTWSGTGAPGMYASLRKCKS